MTNQIHHLILEPDLMGADAIADTLRIHPATLRRWRARYPTIPVVKHGNTLHANRAILLHWYAKNPTQS